MITRKGTHCLFSAKLAAGDKDGLDGFVQEVCRSIHCGCQAGFVAELGVDAEGNVRPLERRVSLP